MPCAGEVVAICHDQGDIFADEHPVSAAAIKNE
jgi:hypothetical protein